MWALILYARIGGHVALATLGGFTSEEVCLVAKQRLAVMEESQYIESVCVQIQKDKHNE